MLQNSSPTADRPWSRRRRLAAGFSLLAVTLGLAALPRPARALAGDKDAPPKVVDTAPLPLKDGPTPFDFRFASDAVPGVVAFRPAAFLRRVGESYLNEEYRGILAEIAERLKVDTKATGFRTLGLEDIDWVIGGLRFGKIKAPDDGRMMHFLEFGHVAVRATAPFDWLAWLRQYGLVFEEARDGGRVYYRVTGPVRPYLGKAPCVCLPDDRTIVFDEEPGMRSLLGREAAPVPAPFKGMDRERVDRSLFLVAIDNQGGRFAKSYDAGRADDAVVLSLFKNVDTWALSVADSDALDLNALGVCPGAEGRTTAAVIESLTSLARRTLDAGNPAAKPGEDAERAARLAKDLLTDLRVSSTDHSVEVRYDGKVTLKKLSGLMDAAAKEANAPR